MGVGVRKVFSIERHLGAVDGQAFDDNDHGARRHGELMAAINGLRAAMIAAEPGELAIVESAPPAASMAIDAESLAEARALKQELQEVHDAIAETKQEIATLHDADLSDTKSAGVSDELGAIVEHTEQATETILSSAEAIDGDATTLVAALSDGPNNELACDIQERVVNIFEACNFQDLTGQRITKIVDTLRFVDARIDKMMEIWGGIEAFEDVTPMAREGRDGDKALLNGPALDGDDSVACQDDIDDMFS